jgi:CheY-like chemotaxis protein
MKLLFVEDNDTSAEMISLLLKDVDLSLEIDRVPTLEQALLKLATGGYDAVVLDLLLFDSAEHYQSLDALVAALKDEHGNVYTPIVVLTAYEDTETETSCLGRGAWEFVGKSELKNPKEVLRKIRNRVIVAKTNRRFGPAEETLRRATEKASEVIVKVSEIKKALKDE